MAARPGRVFSELQIDAPYPRTEEFRTSPSSNEFCRLTSAALHGAMEAAPATP
jgi:NitT/TauT family transport system ATP-binding protein